MNTITIILVFCGAVMSNSPAIDVGTDVGISLSYNGLPRNGKYPGDLPDIGAWEWFPGVTCDNSSGDWNGIPLQVNPRIPLAPTNLQIKNR